VTENEESSLNQLELQAANLEQDIALLEEQTREKNAELQRLKERIESIRTTNIAASKTSKDERNSNVIQEAEKARKRAPRKTDPSNLPTLLGHATRKYKYKCTIEGCTNEAQGGGVCKRHGAKAKICNKDGCTTQAKKGGVCIRHGAYPKICSHEGCTNEVPRKNGVCEMHGAKFEICNYEGCTEKEYKRGLCQNHGANHRGRVCQRHGKKVKIYSHNGCTNIVAKGDVCVKHDTPKHGGKETGAKHKASCSWPMPEEEFELNILTKSAERSNQTAEKNSVILGADGGRNSQLLQSQPLHPNLDAALACMAFSGLSTYQSPPHPLPQYQSIPSFPIPRQSHPTLKPANMKNAIPQKGRQVTDQAMTSSSGPGKAAYSLDMKCKEVGYDNACVDSREKVGPTFATDKKRTVQEANASDRNRAASAKYDETAAKIEAFLRSRCLQSNQCVQEGANDATMETTRPDFVAKNKKGIEKRRKLWII